MTDAAPQAHQKPRGVLVAGNWKMNFGPRETADFFSGLCARTTAISTTDIAKFRKGGIEACVIPPMLSLESARNLARKAPFPLEIGAQNAHWMKSGAFTGEVSGTMLSEIGVKYVLVGHSERRQFFGETDATVRQRAESLLDQGFHVILCIGETRSQRESGRTAEILVDQLDGAIPERGRGAATYLDGRLTLAYEPVWAIGTGLTATPEQAEEAHQIIRKQLWDRFGLEAAGRTRILYGGSVTPENSDSLLACPNVDGVLVGGASLKPESFIALLLAASRALGAD
jgi:triosephosphate isomerase (TIM)